MGKKINVITGAFTYTGRYISTLLIEKGEQVRNLTNHPNRPHDFGDAIESVPMDFPNPGLLAESKERRFSKWIPEDFIPRNKLTCIPA